VSCPPAPDANQAAYDKLRKRLGGDVARALTSQEQLSIALLESAASEQNLNTHIASEEAKVVALEDQITQMETQISNTQSLIDMEQAQLATLARAISRQPDSLLVAMARAGNLHDALVAAADLIVASQRANDLEATLQADMAKLQADHTARLAALSTENGVLAQLTANLTALNSAISQQNDITTQLGALMAQLTAAKAGLTNQPPDVTAALAALLEQQEQQLIQRAYQAAWNQAQVGAGIAMVTRTLPVGTTLPGLRLSWPVAGAWITQPFGPSELLLEPPLGAALAVAIETDACRFLEQLAPLVRTIGEQGIDHLAFDDNTRVGAQPGAAHHVMNVAQTARRAIQKVVALAGTAEPPGDHDFAEGNREGAVVVLEVQRHLGDVHRAPRG
jgi:peptidoglycan hydrolase CwlO-like protein